MMEVIFVVSAVEGKLTHLLQEDIYGIGGFSFQPVNSPLERLLGDGMAVPFKFNNDIFFLLTLHIDGAKLI
jgi:hypothetical protein